jgi:hypothetical protein
MICINIRRTAKEEILKKWRDEIICNRQLPKQLQATGKYLNSQLTTQALSNITNPFFAGALENHDVIFHRKNRRSPRFQGGTKRRFVVASLGRSP